MSNVYIVSDPHFGHEKIAQLRGFKNSYNHDNCIINNHNECVTKRDTIYILGDIGYKAKHWNNLLWMNGKKIIILGNHDYRTYSMFIASLIQEADGNIQISGPIKYKNAWLSHIPVHPMEFDYREYIDINIHGHLHDRKVHDDRYINVCYDVTGMRPIELKSLTNRGE